MTEVTMQFLRNISIRRKQMVIMMLAAATALVLACGAFVTYDFSLLRRELTSGVSTLAEVMGNTTAGTLNFNDSQAATELLLALRAEPNIASACLYDANGTVFARYVRGGRENVGFPAVQPTGQQFDAGQFQLFRPVRHRGETLGTIFIAADLTALDARIRRYLIIAGLVLGASLLVTFGLSTRLQQVVSDPILHLAAVMRRVAQENNYSLRASRQGGDELGQLISGFNAMLEQIQTREAELRIAGEQLEHRVQDRTRELSQSLSLLNATLESTTDGVLALDRAGRLICINSKFAELWQFPDELLERQDAQELAAYSLSLVKEPEKLQARIQQVQTHPEQETFDVIELKDGRVFERYAIPQRVDNQCVGVVVNWRDITARKQAEAELAYERDLLRTLLDHSPDFIYFKDAQSRFIRCSQTLVEAFGAASVEDVIGRTDYDFFDEEHARPAFEDEQEIIRTGQRMIGKIEREFWRTGRVSWALTSKMPLRDKTGQVIGTFGISKDITSIKEAEANLEQVHKQLLDASRQAGMAEIASNVLHNVGNVLNSVNVSAYVLADRIRRSKGMNLARAAALLKGHLHELPRFLTDDPKGRQLPDYLTQLGDRLVEEQRDMLIEVESLAKNIDHIKDIVAMQQNYAKVAGVAETVKVTDLVEDALRMNDAALARHGLKVIREFTDVPPITTQKHKVLQILINLIRNAKYAVDEASPPEKLLRLRTERSGEGMIKISVSDNGIGIAPENMTRIFNHGFTTRKNGHGFGLHSGALAARELDGNLTVHSDGAGRGATFTLELPVGET